MIINFNAAPEMCLFSGRVYMSDMLAGREGNRGSKDSKDEIDKRRKALNGGAIMVIGECDRNRLLFARGILKMNETVFARRTVYFDRCKYFAIGWRVWDNMNLD